MAGFRDLLGQAGSMAVDLVLGRYPTELYGRARPGQELPPVFCFHSAQPAPFAAILAFLRDNRYRTLDADAYHDIVTDGGAKCRERSVLITFDDGVGQIWSVVHPLLRRFDMKATCFLVPGLIDDDPDERRGPNLDDVWVGRSTMAVVTSRDAGDRPLVTWPEIRAMHAGGTIDFQCHTWDHCLVPTSPEIVDFTNPELLRRFHQFEFLVCGDDGPRGRPPLGSPIYTMAPRMSAQRRHLGDPALDRACADHVADHGGTRFFERPDWRRRLLKVVAHHRATAITSPGHETEEQRRQAIRRDLARAKAFIEQRLTGKTVRHLAFPWGVGSDTAIEVARDLGYVSAYWGRVDDRLVNRVGDDPFRLARIGEGFVRSLRGTRRRPLTRVLAGKLTRRLRTGSPHLGH